LLCELNDTQKVRLLITTRCHELDGLRSCLENASMVEVKADPGDIEKYIDTKMEGFTELQKDELTTAVKCNSKGL
jgi:hypothetical protein